MVKHHTVRCILIEIQLVNFGQPQIPYEEKNKKHFENNVNSGSREGGKLQSRNSILKHPKILNH